MKFLQVIALIILISYSFVDAAKSYNPAIINCYIKLLKDANEINDEVQAIGDGDILPNCAEFIDNKKKELVAETVSNIQNKIDVSENELCLEKDLVKNKIIDVTLKAVVFDILVENSGKKYEAEAKDANDKLENVIDDSLMYCLFKEDFSDAFDELFTEESEEEEDLEADYCGRKLVIDNQLLDTSVYTLPLNPKNINLDNVNCEEKLKEVIKKLEVGLSDSMKKEDPQLTEQNLECRLNAFRSGNTYSNMIAAFFFSEINMSAEQKEVEKRKFTIMLGKLAFKAVDCDN